MSEVRVLSVARRRYSSAWSEQRPCKTMVGGSNPSIGSVSNLIWEIYMPVNDISDLGDIGIENARAALALIRATLRSGSSDEINLILAPLERDDMIKVMGGLNGVLLAIARLVFKDPQQLDDYIIAIQGEITKLEARAAGPGIHE